MEKDGEGWRRMEKDGEGWRSGEKIAASRMRCSAATRDAAAPGTTASHYAARRLAAAERLGGLSARALPWEQEGFEEEKIKENVMDRMTIGIGPGSRRLWGVKAR